MNKRRMTVFSIVVSVLVLLLAAFIVRSSLGGHEPIVLPPVESVGEQEGSSGAQDSQVQRVEIRPDTVQSAIASLERASEYGRSITVERYWQGGSSVSVTNAFASGGWLRLDSLETSADIRHTILSDGGTVYIWYNNDRTYFSAPAALTEDAEQGILTYEDVLALPSESIVLADYRSFEGADCIYLETAEDEALRSEHYWVSTADGLLHGAERLENGEVIYRMTVTQTGIELPDTAFTLPDGTELYKPEVPVAARAVPASESKT
ncbi:MAG: hypothetical protein IIV78_03780 [Oscillospiraceae bacterium]|nr:hypothetical protein [Oscillospiraceae bacterium]